MSDRADESGATDFSQDTRSLAIDTPLGPDKALLIALEGEDILSRCFLYRVTIETEQTDSAAQSLLGVPVTLWLHNSSRELRRPIHGYVRRLIGQGHTDRGSYLYRLEVVPHLWFLSCTSDCRIFQNKSIPDILQEVFTDQGLIDVDFRLTRTDYPAVEYCVQYQETALDFVSRLMEHLGLFFWHEHRADRHLLVIADRNAATLQCNPAEVTVSPISGSGELQSLDLDCTFRPGRWALNDYDFEAPTKLLRVTAPTTLTVPGMANHERYEYPGKYRDQDGGRRLSRLRIELEEAQQRRVFGTGRCPGFDPGRRFTASTTRRASGTTYLLTEVRHHATAPYAETGGEQPRYSNDYVAIPADLPFRPQRLTAWPVVHGPQTATVMGPSGESIHTDEYGRVKVLFHWDRHGKRDDTASCWIRVSQHSAGSYWGALSIPHVGQEVVISFLEGDPDRPMVIGRVHNGTNMPPLNLPQDKHKTVIRDQGDNRIVMHGKAGQERLTMLSPKNINLVAMRPPAKPLSSQVIDGVTFDDFKDGASLKELLTVYKQLVNPPPSSTGTDGNSVGTVYASPAPTATTYSVHGTTITGTTTAQLTTADTAASVDINSLSEHDINSLSVLNTNAWVGKDMNTWVNQDSNAQVNGDSNTTINGGSTQSISAYSLTAIDGTNDTFVGGNNSSFVVGLNTSFVFGLNLGMMIGGAYSFVAPSSVQFFSGMNMQITGGTCVQIAANNVQNYGVNMQYNGINCSWDGTTVKVKEGAEMTTSAFRARFDNLYMHM